MNKKQLNIELRGEDADILVNLEITNPYLHVDCGCRKCKHKIVKLDRFYEPVAMEINYSLN